MSKKKKGKVVQLKPAFQSPENYIKNQARQLPVAGCWITEDWQDHGICNIIVARGHNNGNITAGLYLVDLYCLGVKDAGYHFNLPPSEFEYLKDHAGGVEACEYILAHNIIYGAIAFAEDYGFKPHKDFAVAQFVLEEDDDNVELMEIEFGFEGEPYYFRGPNDDEAKVNQIRNTLMRTAGEGNFTIVEEADDDWDDDELEDYDEDIFDDEEDAFDEEDEMLEEIMHTIKPVNKVYERACRTPEARTMLATSSIGKGYRLTEKGMETRYDLFSDAEEETLYDNLSTAFENSQFDRAIPKLKNAITKYPENARFYNLLQACYLFDGQYEKSNELTMVMHSKFEDYLFAMVPYANLLIDQGKPAQALEVFHGKADLDQLYPGRKQFNRHEAAIYFATMCRCYIALSNIDLADLYMNAIFKKDLQQVPHQTLINKALVELGNAKITSIKTKIGWEE
jgi:tetratricopeptide (TPR) repeat protein